MNARYLLSGIFPKTLINLKYICCAIRIKKLGQNSQDYKTYKKKSRVKVSNPKAHTVSKCIQNEFCKY